MARALKTLFAASALVAALAQEPAISRAEIDRALGDDEVCDGDAVACALNALQVKASAVAGAEGGACDRGLVAQIKPLAPGCFKGCPQACGPLGDAINAYMTKGGEEAAKDVICKHKTEFSCAYSHWGDCKTLAVQAGSLGLHIPMSQHEMDTGC
eukprot:CAMPEP_0176272204 /NCGR_PEP_ID=MMETSP0121_2-20121125/45594_1 /TAXON_ID=160619 /ORGANISM="Kryptoperidinium foliaceum, Strain CCMP 1326" /LENGTH=154 /DNA_ID=CAMNT_0017612371 /DNA_START=94 /DNA_END=558 /DNA_ORIENTATION=+